MNKENLEKEKEQIAKIKHKDSIKYMYFSRYLMIRYIVTIFFFMNLMWLIVSVSYASVIAIIFSLIMGIYAAIASIEQLSKMHNRKKDIPITRVYFGIQALVNIILVVLMFFTPIRRSIFPFIINNSILYFMFGFLLIGILLCVLCEYRIQQILEDKDKYYKVIKTFEKYQQ